MKQSPPFLILLSLAASTVLRASEAPFLPFLAWREDEIIRLERPSESGQTAVEFLESAAALLAADLTPAERAAGLEPFLPAGTRLTAVSIDPENAAVRFSLGGKWERDGAVARAELSWLLEDWRLALPEVEEVSLFLLSDEDEEIARIHSAVRPVLEKPEADVPADEETAAGRIALGAPHGPAQGTAQPAGALSDASIFLAPSHGWFYSSGAGRWATQRDNYSWMIEDLNSGESVLQYLHQYLWNAGARIYTSRERDLNTNMVIVQNGGAGYQETGSWTTESIGGAYGGSHRRATTVTGSPTATARFTPNIPEAGYYAVYAWYRRAESGNTTTDARIEIHHTGDTTLWLQDQNRDGFTWKYIGTYYFEKGINPDTGSVVITNQSGTAGRAVIADAIRFGGGMGDMPDPASGTISGKPRWEESGRYYAGFLGKSDWASSGTVDAMPRWAAWEHESWENGKSVYVSWHTNGGGGTGTETFSHTNPVAGSHQLRNLVHDQIIRDIRAEWKSNWANRGPKTANFGELNPNNNNKMPAILIEMAFHDHVEDSKYLVDPEFRRDLARSVYKGLVRFYANELPGFSNATYLPEPPENFAAVGNADGSIDLQWTKPPFSTTATGFYGHEATGYRVYRSRNGYGFDNGTAVSGTNTTLSGFEPGEIVFLRVAATNAGGESFPTATLGVRIPEAAGKKVLIVNGFNRRDRFMNVIENDPYSSNPNSRGYLSRLNTASSIVPHAKAIAAYPKLVGFDSADASVIESGAVSLLDYEAIIWMAGLQADKNDIGNRPTPAFTPATRARLGQYRLAGGQIFLSGAEVAWDADREGQNAWLRTVLKVEYVAPSAFAYTAAGQTGSILDGWTGFFNDGAMPGYIVDSPDVIAPAEGAVDIAEYVGAADSLIDSFDGLSGWKNPSYSGSTSADAGGTFTITGNPVRFGTGAGHLAYEWGPAGTFIRVFNSSLPAFSPDSDFSVWVYGDNSGHRVRFTIRDSEGEFFVNDYTTIDFSGWRRIVWEDVRNNSNRWAGDGDGVVTGVEVRFDSIQLSKTAGAPLTGNLYFDQAATALDDAQIAGVQYDGEHKVVYLAFPFESITDESQQAELMAHTLDFFGYGNTPFEDWQETHFTESQLADPDISGEFADPSGDGVPNILKYALNLNPLEPSRDGLPSLAVADGYLTLTFDQSKAAADLDFVVEVSDDLENWESGETAVEWLTPVDSGDTWRVTVRDRTLHSDSQRRFMRLRVERK